MRYAPRLLLAGGLGLAAAFLVACGGGAGLLSSDQANNLNAQLDQISNDVQSGNCGAAVAAAQALRNAVTDLPATVNHTLTSNLNQGASTVAQRAALDCKASTTTSTTTKLPTTASSTTATSSTTTTTTTTTSSSSSSSPSTSTSTSSSATTSGPTGTNTNGSGGAGVGTGTGTAPSNGNAQ